MKLARTTNTRRLIAAAAQVTALVLTISCRNATEIYLDIHTNLPCMHADRWKGVAVYLGEPGASLEQKSPTLVTTDCDATGHVGSLVVAPSGEKGGVVGVRVVAGLSRKPEDCEAAGYAGCIVARRTVRFTPHSSLELEVALLADCEGQACDLGHTCLTGGCVGSQFVEPPAPAPVVAPAAPSVRCGDNGVRCGTTGDLCCLAVDVPHGTTEGQCLPPDSCHPPNIVLNCDEDTDCEATKDADAGPAWCVLSYERNQVTPDYFKPTKVWLSQCLPRSSPLPGGINVGLSLCEKKQACVGKFSCGAEENLDGEKQLPGYSMCRIDVAAL